MITLLNTLFGEKGELFTIGQGRRVVFAHCKPQISIYERTTQVPIMGNQGCKKKSMRFTVALCENTEFICNSVEETLQKTERYELTADLLRKDGIVERFYFHNISLVEINPDGGWEFDLDVTEEQMQKLLKIANV